MIYSPAEDSFLLEKEVKRYSKNISVLDIGSGSGIQARAAKAAGAKSVLASDIDPESVANVNSLGIKCIKSDLFNKITGKFDLIIFNPPYLPEDKREPKDSQKATTGGKKGDEIILRFLRQSTKHLNKGGKILIVFSTLTPPDRVTKLLNRLGLKKNIIAREKLFMEELQVWLIGRTSNT